MTTKVTTKSADTKAKIEAAAMELFRTRGFEVATMRDIATAAGVATGAAYYYFESKDSIILGFYDQSQQELAPLLDEALSQAKDLRTRLRNVMEVKLAYFAPNRNLLGALAAHTNPRHPLSPFSEATKAIREKDIAVFHQVLKGSKVSTPTDLEPYLPRLLWLYQMGILLFWIFDESEAQSKTSLLIDRSTSLVAKLVEIAGFPLLRPLRRGVLDLLSVVFDG